MASWSRQLRVYSLEISTMKQLKDWLANHTHSWRGTLLFTLLVATEGFFILPVSALLLFFCLENRPKALLYATIATCLTGISSLLGYGIGFLLLKTSNFLLLEYMVHPATFKMLATTFTKYQAFTSFAVAMSPLPYRTLTITVGFLGVPLFPFIPLSIIARGVRFFVIASVAHFWGHNLKYILHKYFYWVLGFGLLVTLVVAYLLQ